jgi:hypothetical protein
MALMTRFVTPGRPLWCWVVEATRYCSFKTNCPYCQLLRARHDFSTYQNTNDRVMVRVVSVVGRTFDDVEEIYDESIVDGHYEVQVSRKHS